VTVMRMSNLFLRTLREDPADAEVPGHRSSCGPGTSAG
jgi:prolyl-tRNA synthetase